MEVVKQEVIFVKTVRMARSCVGRVNNPRCGFGGERRDVVCDGDGWV